MTVNSIDLLVSIPNPIAEEVYHVLGYADAGDSGGGDFYWDPGSSEPANGGTIFSGITTTGRWKRLFAESIDVKWFGATGNGLDDDHTAIQASIDYARAANKKIIFGSGVFLTTETITIYDGSEITGAGRNTRQAQNLTIIKKITNNKNSHNIDAVVALIHADSANFSIGFRMSGLRLEYDINIERNNYLEKDTACLNIGSGYHFSLKNIAFSNATYGIFAKSIFGAEMEDVYIVDCLRGLYANPTLNNSAATACTSLSINNIKIDTCVTAIYFRNLFYSNISGYCQNINSGLANCPADEMPVCFYFKSSSNVTLQFGCETSKEYPGNGMLFYGGAFITLKLTLQIVPTGAFKKDLQRVKIGGEPLAGKEQAFISCNAGSNLNIEDAQLDFQQLANPPYIDYSSTSSMFYAGDALTRIKLNGGYLSTDCYTLIAPETNVSSDNIISLNQRFFAAKNFRGQDIGNVYVAPNFKSGIRFGDTSGIERTLGYYGEGTFTPNITFGGTANGLTYYTQKGVYTRVGDVVSAAIYLYISNKGTGVGNVVISGLPFAAKVVNGSVYTGSCLVGGMNGVVGQVFYFLNEAASHFSLHDIHNGVFDTGGLNDTHFSNSSRLIINLTYKAS